MVKIIGDDNKVRYGVWDEPLDYNYKDFALYDFFGREIKGLRKKFAQGAFNYVGVSTGEYLVGAAAVALGYMNMVFAYLFHYQRGLLYAYEAKAPGNFCLDFPFNPDGYDIRFSRGKNRMRLSKSHATGELVLEASLGGRLDVHLKAPYGLETHHPLRVLNPTEPTRWTFTEKCSPIVPRECEISLDGHAMPCDKSRTTLLYDWSGGYFRRETNWYWGAFSGLSAGRAPVLVGANFAALTNEAYFSENAFWINNQRTRVTRCIFDFDQKNLFKPWRLWDEAKTIDLVFAPAARRGENINALVLKSSFHQFFGRFSGVLRPPDGKPARLENLWGLGEFHRSVW